jgi:hypothetical protein
VQRENDGGGEYGPFLIPEWSHSEGGVHHIVYTLSSWNPYQVHLMETVLTEGGAAKPIRPTGKAPGRPLANAGFEAGTSHWTYAAGGGFHFFTGSDGKPRLTTWGDLGAATMGSLRQSFVPNARTSKLCFYVHGGNFLGGQQDRSASIRLVRGPFEVVRESRGRRADDAWHVNAPELPVVWDLDEYLGDEVTLEIHDERTDGWGFVGTSGFVLAADTDTCLTALAGPNRSIQHITPAGSSAPVCP